MNNGVLKAKVSINKTVKGTVNNKIVYEKLENIEELIDDINNETIEGTAVDKLNYLGDTKDQIKDAIINKGADVEDTDTFRNYAKRINDIPQDKLLDIGGKNPVLIREVTKEVKLSETSFPSITPTTSDQRIYSGVTVIDEDIYPNDYDYAFTVDAYIEPVYTEELPFSSSYIIRSTKSYLSHVFTVRNIENDYFAIDKRDVYNVGFGIAHKSNTEKIETSAVDAFSYDAPYSVVYNNNGKIRINDTNVKIRIRPNNMTADAWEKIDTEKTKIVFNVKLYRVDKKTTPTCVVRQKAVDWGFGG